MSSDKLGDFLKEVSNWDWAEFVRAENDKSYTSNQAIIFALIRACAMQKLPAIKVAIERMSGKLKTPVKIEMPKVFYLYPHASLTGPDVPAHPEIPRGDGRVAPDPTETVNDVITGELLPAPNPQPAPEPEPERDLPSMGMRETLQEMSDYPRELPEAIIELAEQAHRWVQKLGPEPQEIPKVKSVVAAHLLMMAQSRNLDAIGEVFDQIDGKLVETIQLLGDDIYITIYSTTAPPEATLNENGILQLEAPDAATMWANKLGKEQ